MRFDESLSKLPEDSSKVEPADIAVQFARFSETFGFRSLRQCSITLKLAMLSISGCSFRVR
jgi:hypothetical protein